MTLRQCDRHGVFSYLSRCVITCSLRYVIDVHQLARCEQDARS